jgi:hypothetical protein
MVYFEKTTFFELVIKYIILVIMLINIKIFVDLALKIKKCPCMFLINQCRYIYYKENLRLFETGRH